jgi:hypothetical protein
MATRVLGELRMNSRNDPAASAVTPAVGWHGAEAQTQVLHVITLVSSTAPMPLQAPKVPELAGLAVFRSRRVEDGRERFRLHIGYFPSAAAAEQLLPLVRTLYPAAFVSMAPQSNLGSLEDTAVARFSILKPIEEAVVEPLPAPAPQLPPLYVVPAVPPVLSPADSLALLTVGAPAAAPAPVSEPQPTAAPAPAVEPRAVQRYAVQLIWSKDAIDLAKIPSLAIFGGYLLYAVETEPSGRRMYGVRLGFYEDALSARLVSQYVRSEFKGVAVVPVSEREIARASSASIRLSSARGARGSAGARVRWPQSAVTVAFAPARMNAAENSL